MAGPVELSAELFARDNVEFAGGTGETADAFGEGEGLWGGPAFARTLRRGKRGRRRGRVVKYSVVAQIVISQKAVVVPTPVAVNVADVAFAAFAVTGIPDIEPCRIPGLQIRTQVAQQVM